MLIPLPACGKSAKSEQGRTAGETGYVLSHYQKLPEAVTHISRCFLGEDKLYLCCWEEAEANHAAYYAATMDTDGSKFQKLALEHTDTEIMLDIAPDRDGGLWTLYSAPGENETPNYTLCRFDGKGRMILEKPLNGILEAEGALRYDPGRNLFLNTDGDGNVCVTVKQSKTYSFLLDREGNSLFNLQHSWTTQAAINAADGQILVCITTGDGECYLLPVNMEMQDWDTVRQTFVGPVDNVFSGAGDACYYFYDVTGFYSADLCQDATETISFDKVKLFNWSNLGLANGDSHLCPLSDGRFAAVTGISSQTGQMSYAFSIAEPGEDQRTVLTMCSIQPDSSLVEAVALFNRSNDGYKVELTSTFSLHEQANSDDWNNAVTNLNTRLMAGDIPDLIDLNSLPVEAIFQAGYLEDLNPYLKNDATIDLDNYFANVFTALSIYGKLPYVTGSVTVLSMFADASAVGREQHWTVEEYLALKNSGEIVVRGMAPSQFLEMLLTADTQFVNWETGECSFDSDAFIHLLELCKSMADAEMTTQLIPEDSQANCLYAPLVSIMDVAWYNDALGGNANPIGFPTTGDKPLHALKPSNKIGISAACEHKDGAWAFVRSFLEPTLQESGWFFPYLKSSFEKITSAAMEGNTNWRGGLNAAEITEADIALAREILCTAEYCTNGDNGLIELIMAQAEDYFQGQKTAREAAATIQSRAELYVGERMP